ncbi:MAG: hypothetical protein DMF22_06415 [Verrucomicrobia bacterium]|nr:MAG: hypothetical protein DMF22_06415 [Verrucomicrobiota bacterium]
MEEAEVPLEHLHEHVHESAEHSGAAWISWVALSTAILAVLAAIAGLLSGKHANEAMINQIEASDQWSYYQAKSIKAAVLDAKIALSAMPSEKDREKTAKYQEEESEIKSEAEHKEADAKSNFHKHEVFARGVTMFQIAIAIAAISALTKKPRFWIVSLLFGGYEKTPILDREFVLRGRRMRFPRARRDREVEAIDLNRRGTVRVNRPYLAATSLGNRGPGKLGNR